MTRNFPNIFTHLFTQSNKLVYFLRFSKHLYKSTQNLRCCIFVKKISVWSLIFSLYKHPSFVTHMNKERMRLYLGNWTENSAINNNNQAEISTIQHDRIFPYEWMAKFAPLTRQTWLTGTWEENLLVILMQNFQDFIEMRVSQYLSPS